jgi:hypothetical protein
MEGSKGSKNQSQIMPYAQCKTYEQRNECAKYIIKFFWVILLLLGDNFIKKTLHPKKTITYSISKSKRKNTKTKKDIP